MKQRKVKEFKRKLREVQKRKNKILQQAKILDALKEEMDVEIPTPTPGNLENYVHHTINGIYTILQTETMVNTCNVAMWACLFALLAAVAGAAGAIAAWLTLMPSR